MDEFQETQLQLVGVEPEGPVEAMPEGVEVLLRQAGDQVNVQVDVARRKDSLNPVHQLVHVGVAVAGVQRGGVEGLQPRFHLEQPCRSRR